MSPRNFLRSLYARINRKDHRLSRFFEEYKEFERLNNDRFTLSKNNIYKCVDDNTSTTHFDAHYIYHPAWAARIIKVINPGLHIDIASTLHFCTLLSAFVKIEFYDYRVAALNLDNLSSQRADLTNLHFKSASISSMSCMHTIEHIGLGRYGDKLDPDGDIKAINELMRVCNGDLLIAVPVGRKKLMFNAHRIYDAEEFASYFTGFKVMDFSLVTDANDFIRNASFELASTQNYGCGCYWFQKSL